MNLELIDSQLRAWSLAHDAAERAWPVLIPAATLRRAGYDQAFPHLLMSASVLAEPDGASSPLHHSGYDLSPAVCYHAYAALQNQELAEGVIYAARGHCFRNEDPNQLQQGRRQLEFQMRELIFVGAPGWIEEQLQSLEHEIAGLAHRWALEGSWRPASDPFFLPNPAARGQAALQKVLNTKQEFCLPDGLAISSINRHRAFFGERFDIRLRCGTPAFSACVAFGLDRWAAHTNTRT